ncbi:hypothetical protein [Streptomyces sp. URMC 124]|uniref:hypothetical protein n=1 Tax=Streptomyces sp. URMC 124 TaxID=3423405 RepID=UPI003F1BC00C
MDVLRHFRKLLAEAEFENPKAWTTRALRTNFLSLLSDHGVPTEEIARILGRNGSATTEKVHGKQLHPVITAGAEAMDETIEVALGAEEPPDASCDEHHRYQHGRWLEESDTPPD